MSGLKWTRRTTRKVARELKRMGIPVSAGTVGRLLNQMGYSLRVNVKQIELGLKNPPSRQDRNRQFSYIAQQRERVAQVRNPIISVDSKKRELIGQFKNPGRCWVVNSIGVNDHDPKATELLILAFIAVVDESCPTTQRTNYAPYMPNYVQCFFIAKSRRAITIPSIECSLVTTKSRDGGRSHRGAGNPVRIGNGRATVTGNETPNATRATKRGEGGAVDGSRLARSDA